MERALLRDIEAFQAKTGLSDHRVGILLANNGRLLERLRSGGRVWPETAQKIREAVERELADHPPAEQEDAA